MRPALATVALLCACGPNPAAPVKVMALLYKSGRLQPQQTELSTLASLTALKGTAAELVGGASVVIDPTDPAQRDLSALTQSQLEDALYRDRGGDVRGDFVEKASFYWPADFHTWNMVTTYWNLEETFLYFQRIYDGASTELLRSPRVLYWGNYKNLGIADPDRQDAKDNALYFAPLQAFILTPWDALQKVPLAMNLGVIGHEYGHRVFAQKALGNIPVHPAVALNGPWAGPALNQVKGLDEGLADLHGWGVTCVAKDGRGCTTRFLDASFDVPSLVDKRDFSRAQPGENCMTEELRTAIQNQLTGVFLSLGKEYELGTLFAAALYQAANKAGEVEAMQKAIIKAYDDTSTATPGLQQMFDAYLSNPEKVTLEALSDVILSHITSPNLQRLACNELWERLDLHPEDRPLAHCPSTSLRGTASCPVLPP
jgi:hypothetical protein